MEKSSKIGAQEADLEASNTCRNHHDFINVENELLDSCDHQKGARWEESPRHDDQKGGEEVDPSRLSLAERKPMVFFLYVIFLMLTGSALGVGWPAFAASIKRNDWFGCDAALQASSSSTAAALFLDDEDEENDVYSTDIAAEINHAGFYLSTNSTANSTTAMMFSEVPAAATNSTTNSTTALPFFAPPVLLASNTLSSSSSTSSDGLSECHEDQEILLNRMFNLVWFAAGLNCVTSGNIASNIEPRRLILISLTFLMTSLTIFAFNDNNPNEAWLYVGSAALGASIEGTIMVSTRAMEAADPRPWKMSVLMAFACASSGIFAILGVIDQAFSVDAAEEGGERYVLWFIPAGDRSSFGALLLGYVLFIFVIHFVPNFFWDIYPTQEALGRVSEQTAISKRTLKSSSQAMDHQHGVERDCVDVSEHSEFSSMEEGRARGLSRHDCGDEDDLKEGNRHDIDANPFADAYMQTVSPRKIDVGVSTAVANNTSTVTSDASTRASLNETYMNLLSETGNSSTVDSAAIAGILNDYISSDNDYKSDDNDLTKSDLNKLFSNVNDNDLKQTAKGMILDVVADAEGQPAEVLPETTCRSPHEGPQGIRRRLSQSEDFDLCPPGDDVVGISAAPTCPEDISYQTKVCASSFVLDKTDDLRLNEELRTKSISDSSICSQDDEQAHGQLTFRDLSSMNKEFWLFVLAYVVNCSRYSWVVGTFDPQADLYGQENGSHSQFFGFALMFGALLCGFPAGAYFDRSKSLAVDSLIVNLVVTASVLMMAVPVLDAQYVSALLFVVFRGFLAPAILAYVVKRYGYHNIPFIFFGVMVPLANLASMLQIPIVQLCMASDSFLVANLLVGVVGFLAAHWQTHYIWGKY